MITNQFKAFILIVATAIHPTLVIAQNGLYIGENVPISFYGRVVDQSENPVPNAKISLLLIITHYSINSGEQRMLTTKTDQNGSFNVKGLDGHAIDVTAIEKEGYQLSRKCERDFTYGSPHTPPETSPARPIIFKMWKEVAKEPLVTGTKTFKIPSDGEPFTIDLLKRQKKPGISPPGDIIVRVSRPSKLIPGKKFDWSYSIEAIQGGIIYTNSDFLYQAPETGYKQKYEFSSPATNAHWSGWARSQFYIKSREGKIFGSIDSEISTDYGDNAAFKVNFALNPAGSRNLER